MYFLDTFVYNVLVHAYLHQSRVRSVTSQLLHFGPLNLSPGFRGHIREDVPFVDTCCDQRVELRLRVRAQSTDPGSAETPPSEISTDEPPGRARLGRDTVRHIHKTTRLSDLREMATRRRTTPVVLKIFSFSRRGGLSILEVACTGAMRPACGRARLAPSSPKSVTSGSHCQCLNAPRVLLLDEGVGTLNPSEREDVVGLCDVGELQVCQSAMIL
jgi:hypothetical protein